MSCLDHQMEKGEDEMNSINFFHLLNEKNIFPVLVASLYFLLFDGIFKISRAAIKLVLQLSYNPPKSKTI